MKYTVWFLRFLFAAWMIPAGVNHFYQIFPQPMGNQPLSQELIRALIDSRLFDLVKAVELVAGVGVLIGYRVPLMLLICLPVSFGVFYWDAPLEGWGSRAAHFGYATLLCNSLLCLAFAHYYRAMFTLRSEAAWHNKQLVLAGRVVFGLWMMLNGANYLFLSFWAAPSGAEPLAMQLMTSLVNSRLLDVAMAMQMVGGALILAGLFVPLALCALMPISTCALFWAVILDQSLLNGSLALVAFALNGLLMLAFLPSYLGSLQPYALSFGETEGPNTFDDLYVSPGGRTSRALFVPAMVTVLVAIAFFDYFVPGRTGQFCMLVLVYPASVLLAQRLRDMGYSAWLVLVPLVPVLALFAGVLGYINLGAAIESALPWGVLATAGALVIFAGVKTGSSGPAQSTG